MLLDDGLENELIQQQVTQNLSLAKFLDLNALSAQLDPETELGKQVSGAQEQHTANGSEGEFRCTLLQSISLLSLHLCNVLSRLQCSPEPHRSNCMFCLWHFSIPANLRALIVKERTDKDKRFLWKTEVLRRREELKTAEAKLEVCAKL